MIVENISSSLLNTIITIFYAHLLEMYNYLNLKRTQHTELHLLNTKETIRLFLNVELLLTGELSQRLTRQHATLISGEFVIPVTYVNAMPSVF